MESRNVLGAALFVCFCGLGAAMVDCEPKADSCIAGASVEEEPTDNPALLQVQAGSSKERVLRLPPVVAPGAMFGRFRLVELLAKVPRAPLHTAFPQLEWPENFSDEFTDKYGEGTLLGKGGQGEVWKAEDPATGKPVAVKIFLDWTSAPMGYLFWDGANEEQKEALRYAMSECELMMTFEAQKASDPAGHSHLLECYENNVIPEDGSPLPCHIVLEFGGPDLTKWIQEKKGTLGDPAEARKWIAQIAQALRFLQSRDPPIVHRDLKPDNVMLAKGDDGEDTIKVFDFGCASNGTEEGQHSGNLNCFTLAYAAPEISGFRCRDPQDPELRFRMPAWSFDIFSVGMMYWEMLCPNMSSKNGDYTWFMKFLCVPPPVGMGGYIPGTLRALFDSKTEAGDSKCPPISDAEVDLIESMVGPFSDRPSPTEVLNFPLLAKYDH